MNHPPPSQALRLYFAIAEMPRETCKCGSLTNGGELVLRSAEGIIQCRACAKGWWPK